MRSSLPKVLHPLCGRPLIAWPIEAARAAGAGKVVVVDGPKRRLADHLPEDVVVAVQSEPRGTGDAVAAAAGEIGDGDTVVVTMGDVPLVDGETLTALVEAHDASGAAATMLTAELEDPTGYGRVVRDAEGQVERVVETKTAGDASEAELAIREVNTGIFAFDGDALKDALERLESDNAQGELYLPDVLPRLKEAGREVGAHVATNPDVTRGINDRVDLARVRAIAQERINEAHMRAGVTLVDPRSAHIEAGVTIGADTVIEPELRDPRRHHDRRRRDDRRLHPADRLRDRRRRDRAALAPAGAHAWTPRPPSARSPTCVPAPCCRRARRPARSWRSRTRRSAPGSKVPHLSYIGDADVGEGTNLGASTITSNYDGRRKHRTTIGDRVRTSVDTTLVAPVTVGDDAYTGAGSVITDDVPPGALGIARARQTNKEGYAERVSRRER